MFSSRTIFVMGKIMKPEEKEALVKSVEKLARLMDSRFALPGMPVKLGLDTIIGLIPVLGDTIGLSISGYIIAQAKRLGVSDATLMKMSLNVFLDWLIGLVPILGDLFDWGWQANNRNARLLRKHYEKHLRGDGLGETDERDMIDVTPRE